MAIRNFDAHRNDWLVEFTAKGEPASKANSRRLVASRGKPMFIKSKKALGYVDLLSMQCPTLDPLLITDLIIAIEIHYASRRPDLDESLILDILQDRIYKNDRQIKEKHIYWALDKHDPRIEIKIAELADFS